MSDVDDRPRSSAISPVQPPSLRRHLGYILGFTVSTGVGLAPYLGKVNVPLFDPLLNLIPNSLQNTLLPLSAALMGLVAVVVQWFAQERLAGTWLRRTFLAVLVSSLLTFAALVVVHTFVVVSVQIEGGKDRATFLVGFSRPDDLPCTVVEPAPQALTTSPPGPQYGRIRRLSDADCIRKLSFDEAQVIGFWGDRAVRIARLSLFASYLCFTSCIGLAVGLLVLKRPSV
jgi:hypothetical protein